MNYFDRLLRRLALDSQLRPTPALNDPFDLVAEWPLEVTPAIAASTSAGSAIATNLDFPSAIAPTPEPPPSVPPLAPDPHDAAAGPAFGDSSAEILTVSRPAEMMPKVDASSAVTGVDEVAAQFAVPMTPLAVADAFFASLTSPERQRESAAVPPPRGVDERIAPPDRLSAEHWAVQMSPPGIQSVLPTPPSAPAPEIPDDRAADVSIGRIEVIVERETIRENVMPAPRVIVIPASGGRSAPAATAGPSSQRFGLGQV